MRGASRRGQQRGEEAAVEGAGDAWGSKGGTPRRCILPGGENSGGAAKPWRGAALLLRAEKGGGR